MDKHKFIFFEPLAVPDEPFVSTALHCICGLDKLDSIHSCEHVLAVGFACQLGFDHKPTSHEMYVSRCGTTYRLIWEPA